MKQFLSTVALIFGLAVGACSEKSATEPPAPATLAVSLSSTAAEITQGGTLALTVNVTRQHFDGAVAVTVSGVSGVTASPLSIPAGATSGVLTLNADGAAAPGGGTLTISAAGPAGTPTQAATLALAVNVRGAYTLSATPVAVSLFQGGVATTTITTARENSFAGTVTLTVQAPAGLTATLTPTSLSGTTNTAALSVTAAADAAEGTYTIRITGTTPGLESRTVNVSATVARRSPPPFSGTIFLDPDIITPNDPTTFTGLTYVGRGTRTMFDRRVNNWITADAFLFAASFDDGLTAEVQVNPEFGTPTESQVYAERYAREIGRLPTALRKDVQTVWIHKGVQPFGGGNNNLLIHVGQADLYTADGILEETLFHEAAHTSLDAAHARAPGWVAAQAADPTSISTYARDFPDREDIAESVLPWFAIRYRVDRISASLRDVIVQSIPNRIAYFDALGLAMHPIR